MHDKFGSTFSVLSEILGDGCAVNRKAPVNPFFVHSAISSNWHVYFSGLMLPGNYALSKYLPVGIFPQ